MRNIAAVGIALLASTFTAHAQEAGIGMWWNGGPGILVPVKVGEHLALEGLLSFQEDNRNVQFNGSTFEDRWKSESIGVALFWQRSEGESARFYAGPRIAYIRSAQAYIDQLGQRSDSTSHGWSVAPTMGMEYFPIKRVSIGAEVGLSYSSTSGTANGNLGGVVKARDLSTTSSVVIRYYF